MQSNDETIQYKQLHIHHTWMQEFSIHYFYAILTDDETQIQTIFHSGVYVNVHLPIIKLLQMHAHRSLQMLHIVRHIATILCMYGAFNIIFRDAE